MRMARMTRRKWVGLLLCGAWFIATTIWSTLATEPPLAQRMSLEAPSTLTRNITVMYAEEYELVLKFDRSGHAFQALHEAYGQQEGEGIPTNVSWSLTGIDHPTVTLGESRKAVTGSLGWSDSEVSRLVSSVKVPRGVYQFELSMLDSPKNDLFPSEALIYLGVNMKNTTSWEVGIAYWMSTINVTLLLFFLAVFLYRRNRSP